MNLLTIWDFILAPVFLILLLAIATRLRNNKYPNGHPLRRYYMPALYAKFGGCLFITFIFAFYYGGGDTYNFYWHTILINRSLDDSFLIWFKLVTHQSVADNPEIYKYASAMEWYTDPSSFMVAQVAAVFSLITGTHYLPIAILFAFFSFTGVWAMYRTFANIYPNLHKELAIAFLFIPSTLVWGSAIYKDTICMFGLGWLTYTTFRIFINRDFSARNLILLVVSFYLLYKIKVYILLGFLPALMIWLLTTYSTRIKSAGLRTTVKLAFMGLSIVAFLFFTRLFAQELQKYSLENIAKTATVTRQWLAYSSGDEGSAYDLGQFDPSIAGMLKKFPQAVVVTLFRPFPWEARKVIVLVSALEALAFSFFTVKAISRHGIGRSIKLIGKDPNVLFFLIFSVIFAFAVGISSYNFGALSRYKIPCLPFYGAFLMVLLHHDKMGTTKTTVTRKKKYTPAWAKGLPT